MKLQLLQEQFSKSLNLASRFASPKVQLPVLANVLLSTQNNKLLIAATNLEMSISLSVGAKIEEEGSITIPAKTLNDLVTNIGPGQLSLETDKEQMTIKAEGFSSTITGMNSSDFPSIPQTLEEESVAIPWHNLESALNEVLFSVSSDESRPILTGVLLIFNKDSLVLASTDGFRLSQKLIKIPTAPESKVILPKSALAELLRLGGNTDSLKFLHKKGEGQVIFGLAESVISSRTIEGEFPDFEKIIPKSSAVNIEADVEDLTRAIKLASVFARDAANVVKMEIGKDGMDIYAESQKSGNQKTHLDVKVDNETGKEPFIIAFNYKYLEDFLTCVKGESVSLHFNDPNASGVFRNPKDKDYLHIIMPVRLQS